MAFFELEPWGSEIDDHRFGIITSTIANVNRDPKKKPTAYKPEDFFPPRKTEEEELQDNADKWRAFIASFKKKGG